MCVPPVTSTKPQLINRVQTTAKCLPTETSLSKMTTFFLTAAHHSCQSWFQCFSAEAQTSSVGSAGITQPGGILLPVSLLVGTLYISHSCLIETKTQIIITRHSLLLESITGEKHDKNTSKSMTERRHCWVAGRTVWCHVACQFL